MGNHNAWGGISSFVGGKYVPGEGIRSKVTAKSSTQVAKERYPSNKVVPPKKKVRDNSKATEPLFFPKDLKKLLDKARITEKEKRQSKRNKRR